MKGWVLSQAGDQWSVKFDVGDLGGHLDTTFRGWSATLAAGVRLVIARLVLIFVSFWIFMVGCGLLGLCTCLLRCMGLRPLCLHLIA